MIDLRASPRLQLNFSDFEPTPSDHFRLRLYGVIHRVIEQAALSLGSLAELVAQFPFLESYLDELRELGVQDDDPTIQARWREATADWEERVKGHLPLRALQQGAGLDDLMLDLLLAIGLIEEDARFGLLFEQLQTAPGHRPTFGLMNAWWRAPVDSGEVRAGLRRLQELGLVQVMNPEAPRLFWALHVPALIWDALRGDLAGMLAQRLEFIPLLQLPPISSLILPAETAREIAALPGLFASSAVRTWILRGLRHNCRRTIAAALARELGLGVLRADNLKADDERWRQLGSMASLVKAMPLLVFELAPGESIELPHLTGWSGPVVVVLDRFGGISGPASREAVSVSIDMPDLGTRRRIWQRFLPGAEIQTAERLVERHRLTSGHLGQLASRSQAYAALAGHSQITAADVQRASRSLRRQVLDLMAERVAPAIGWTELAAGAATQRELQTLEHRCRHRERLQTSLDYRWSGRLNAGVRALFSGPSGTGKTLAARALAASLEMDLYRVDLSTVVNKYIGETEKNLNQLFARAEELDVILLLDEGDALLTRRTEVTTANDRYANLETNYLLQRIETFEGILIVTTNAGDRIDSAFQRRMDVIIDFVPPGPEERWHIWQVHLPPEHAIGSEFLEEIASRCGFSGGQIRNAVLHASLLALADGGTVTEYHVRSAVQREYLKQGGICPLRHGAG
jgi:ATPase family associated with various cellular activities (AAA)